MTTPHQNECCVMCRESPQGNVCNLSNCVCHSTQSEWEKEFDEFLEAFNINWRVATYGEVVIESAVKNFIRTLLAQTEAFTTKAYGGCTSCYGKGYSTSKTYTSGAEDFGGEGFTYENNPYIPCPKCDRGKQIERLMEYTEAHTRRAVIEECRGSVPKDLLEAAFNPASLHAKQMYNLALAKTRETLAKLKR